MLKERSHKDKLILLQDWLPEILMDIKKDLKNEHLKHDSVFCKTYLPGKNVQKATHEELTQAYKRALIESDTADELAEFISNRWLLKHADIYHLFAQHLEKINPDFSVIEELDQELSQALVSESVEHFGAPLTYLFSMINAVVFPAEIYQQLSQKAVHRREKEVVEKQQNEEQASLEHLKRTHELQIARLIDKYEKKLIGLQKKYVIDTENLKKQLAALKRRVSGT